MLEDYFSKNTPVGVTQEQKQRLLAVQAALEIAKSNHASQFVVNDMDAVKNHVSEVADAIQEALKI